MNSVKFPSATLGGIPLPYNLLMEISGMQKKEILDRSVVFHGLQDTAFF